MNAISGVTTDPVSSASRMGAAASGKAAQWMQKLDSLAQQLNVTPDVLQKDIQAARQQAGGSGKSGFISALAQQLGVDPAQLQTAMQQVGMGTGNAQGAQGGRHHHHHGGGGGLNMDAVAQQLGVQPQDLKNAFQTAIQQSQQNTGDSGTTIQQSKSQLLAAVAKQLSIDPNTLQSAMQQNSMKIVNTYS